MVELRESEMEDLSRSGKQLRLSERSECNEHRECNERSVEITVLTSLISDTGVIGPLQD